MHPYLVKILVLLLLPTLFYAQPSHQWGTETDTLKCLSNHNSKNWIVYTYNIRAKDLAILIPKTSFLNLARKHYRFLKRTGQPVYFKAGNPNHIENFRKTLALIQNQDSTFIDSSFVHQHDCCIDIQLVVESFLATGNIVLKHHHQYLSSYIRTQIYPLTIPTSIEPEFIPQHLAGGSGNSKFKLMRKDFVFYTIQNIATAPTIP